jgi:predicted transglutaminase-like cysteine proteinase
MFGRSLGLKRAAHGVAALLLLGLAAQVDVPIDVRVDVNEPFGVPTIVWPESPLSVIWRNLQLQMQLELPTIARCRDEGHLCTSPAALQFIAIVDEGKNHEGLSRIGRINRAVNFSLLPFDAGAPGSIQTMWMSPLGALAAGKGNCKHYAVVKYAAMREAGFALDDLRLVIVSIESKQSVHAVVAVRHQAQWYVLDNRTLAIVDSNELHDYLPLFTLDHRGMRKFIVPNPHVVGSACDETVG